MSYANNPTSILAGAGNTVTPITGTGANTITISASGLANLAIRNALVTPVVVSAATDDVVSVQVPGPVPVAATLPIGVLGQSFTIKDGLGLASPITPITITPTAGSIDGAVAAVINVPYGSLTVVYNGTQWLIL